jgi:hypothetical protein
VNVSVSTGVAGSPIVGLLYHDNVGNVTITSVHANHVFLCSLITSPSSSMNLR